VVSSKIGRGIAMKRKFLIAALVLVVALAFTLSGCKSPTPLTHELFREKAEEAEFTVEKDGADVSVATSPNGYTITLKIFSTDEAAKSAYSTREGLLPDGSSSSVKVDLPRHNFTKLTSGGRYYVIYRIGSTLLEIWDVDASSKNEIADFLKSVGY